MALCNVVIVELHHVAGLLCLSCPEFSRVAKRQVCEFSQIVPARNVIVRRWRLWGCEQGLGLACTEARSEGMGLLDESTLGVRCTRAGEEEGITKISGKKGSRRLDPGLFQTPVRRLAKKNCRA